MHFRKANTKSVCILGGPIKTVYAIYECQYRHILDVECKSEYKSGQERGFPWAGLGLGWFKMR